MITAANMVKKKTLLSTIYVLFNALLNWTNQDLHKRLLHLCFQQKRNSFKFLTTKTRRCKTNPGYNGVKSAFKHLNHLLKILFEIKLFNPKGIVMNYFISENNNRVNSAEKLLKSLLIQQKKAEYENR